MSYEPVTWGSCRRPTSTGWSSRRRRRPRRSISSPSRAARRNAPTSTPPRWGIPHAHGSYEALLADPEIEAIYISLPNKLHVEWSIKAAEAGKHVLCEKPFDSDPDRVDDAFDAADTYGTHLMEAFMWRHNPQTKKLQELLRDGVIGELRLVRSCFSYGLYDEDNIRLRTDAEGGALMDVGCYCISGSRLVAGEPEEVFGRQWTGPSSTDWVFTGSLQFADDVLGIFDCGTAMTNRDELEAIGSEGSLFLDDPWHCRKPVIELRREEDVERIEVEPADSYGLELENLSDAIRGVGRPLLGRDDAVAQARVIQALFQSAAAETSVSLE